MSTWNHYFYSKTVKDALQVLRDTPAPTRIIAGGTDLLLDLQQGRHSPVDTLVDITGIAELTCLEIRQDQLFIGAAAPLKVITTSPLIQEHAEALSEACGLIGGPQVRNTATLGGNVAHALPAADGTIALLAVDARAEVASLTGRRWLALSELFSGPGRSTLDPQKDILVGFLVPQRAPHQASAFSRIMRPQGVALPILNMAVWLERGGDTITKIRISLGPSGPTPQRALNTETCLLGQRFTPERLSLAVETLLQETHFRTSPHRASVDYRKQLSRVLLEDVLLQAWDRAGADPHASLASEE